MSHRRTSRSGESLRTLGLILAGAGLFGAGVYLGWHLSPEKGEAPGVQESPPVSTPSPEEAEPKGPLAGEPLTGQPEPSGEEPGEALPPPVQGAFIALVIDDLGRSLAEIDALDRLAVPLSYAVLPYEPKTREVVAELRRRRKEILCHLPMEAWNGANPGPGALSSAMSLEELAAATRAALAAVPGAVGLNNHMGSSLSADPRAMAAILAVVGERQLFFLDSRTSPRSVGYRTALSLGIPAAERHVFLDGDRDTQAIRHQFRRLLDVARQRGSAIAIAHPHSTTLEVLAAEIPVARDRGYEFVPVSYLLDRTAAHPE